MKTRVIRTILEDYRDRLTDSLASELSRAQRQTDEHNLHLVTEALADLAALDGEWNAAIEAAAEKIAAAFIENDMPSTAHESAEIIRALKREANAPTPRDTEGLWDIVRELKERPCENGNDCRPKVAFQHPCLQCAARMEWEAK